MDKLNSLFVLAYYCSQQILIVATIIDTCIIR